MEETLCTPLWALGRKGRMMMIMNKIPIRFIWGVPGVRRWVWATVVKGDCLRNKCACEPIVEKWVRECVCACVHLLVYFCAENTCFFSWALSCLLHMRAELRSSFPMHKTRAFLILQPSLSSSVSGAFSQFHESFKLLLWAHQDLGFLSMMHLLVTYFGARFQ